MKVVGFLSILLGMWGIIWGIFFRDFIWLSVVGMVLGAFYCVFGDEE